jgi:hypothetical protein
MILSRRAPSLAVCKKSGFFDHTGSAVTINPVSTATRIAKHARLITQRVSLSHYHTPKLLHYFPNAFFISSTLVNFTRGRPQALPFACSNSSRRFQSA